MYGVFSGCGQLSLPEVKNARSLDNDNNIGHDYTTIRIFLQMYPYNCWICASLHLVPNHQLIHSYKIPDAPCMVLLPTCLSTSLYHSISLYNKSSTGRAGGGSFKREKNYRAKKEFAYRMCARRPTSTMPKPFLCCEPAFCRSMVVM